MRRRTFIAGLGSAAAWPVVARAQQRQLPVIGFLHGQRLAAVSMDRLAAFHHGLAEGGYVEGRNVAIEYRWAEGDNSRLGALAADLVDRRVSVLAALGNTVTALAAKAATDKIPIVFLAGTDPVEVGLVASFNRPSGNVTGIATLTGPVTEKRVAMLREIVPRAVTVAFIGNPTNPIGNALETREVEIAAAALNLRLVVLGAGDQSGIEAAFASLIKQPADAMIVGADPFFAAQRVKLAILAARHGLPTMYWHREIVEVGGLMSYGAPPEATYEQAGIYVARILNGSKPADLPVVQPTRFRLVINLSTAKALGIEIPGTLLAIADEVIE